MYVGAFNAARENPWSGIGFGALRNEGKAYGGVDEMAHGHVLKILVGTGVMGLAPFLTGVLFVFAALWRAYRCAVATEHRDFVAALAAGWCGILVAGVFNPVLSHPMFYVLAVLAVLTRNRLECDTSNQGTAWNTT
jgi:O-antigen ligase